MLAAAIVLAAVTGARRGELCALRWSDIDWNRRTLTIARSLTVVHQQATEGPTKTHQQSPHPAPNAGSGAACDGRRGR